MNASVAQRLAAIALLGALSLVPLGRWDALVRPNAFGLLVLLCLSGFGHLVRRAAGILRVGFGLRVVWGASLVLFVGGVLMALSLAKAPVLWILVGLGAVSFVAHAESAPSALLRRAVCTLRRAPLCGSLHAGLFFLTVFLWVSASADLSTNPHDDDFAYYPFVRQILDRGELLDPFSFRRLSTLGGQSFLHALLALRLDVLELNLFDRGMCVAVVVALLLSLRVRGRKIPWGFSLCAAAFFLLLRSASINSASYYSGTAFFLALFATRALVRDGASVRERIPLYLVCGATCTLRQNYLISAGIFVAVCAWQDAWRRPWSEMRKKLLFEALPLLSIVLGVLLPWCLSLYRSSHTWFWPLMNGTFNRAAAMVSGENTLGRQAAHLVSVVWGVDPIHPFVALLLGALLMRPVRPYVSSVAWLSTLLGVLALSVSFSLADSTNLSRYHFGFVSATALFTWCELGLGGVFFPRQMVSRFLYVASLFRDGVWSGHGGKAWEERIRNIELRAHITIDARPSQAMQDMMKPLQAVVPAHEPLLALLEEPYALDHGRNRILNLDMPGLAGPSPGFPSFQGPEALAAYLARHARYLAVVRDERALYVYRKRVWYDHMYSKDEVWRVYAPFILDALESLDALTRTRKRLYDADGMVVLDLAEPTAPTPR